MVAVKLFNREKEIGDIYIRGNYNLTEIYQNNEQNQSILPL